MAHNRIVIDAEPRDPFPVSLVGQEYLVTPPKSTIALKLAERAKAAGEDPGKVREELDGWVLLAFGKKQAAKVQARLDDAEDDLDLPHIMTLMQKLAEAATGDPTS
jgi:hypothetical protein